MCFFFSFRIRTKRNLAHLAFHVNPPPTLESAPLPARPTSGGTLRTCSQSAVFRWSRLARRWGPFPRRSGGARRASRSQIEVRVNDSSNSLSCVMLTARLSWINSDAHSRHGIWFQMEHKSGRWNAQFCFSFEEAYWELVPVLLWLFHLRPHLSHNCCVNV